MLIFSTFLNYSSNTERDLRERRERAGSRFCEPEPRFRGAVRARSRRGGGGFAARFARGGGRFVAAKPQFRASVCAGADALCGWVWPSVSVSRKRAGGLKVEPRQPILWPKAGGLSFLRSQIAAKFVALAADHGRGGAAGLPPHSHPGGHP